MRARDGAQARRVRAVIRSSSSRSRTSRAPRRCTRAPSPRRRTDDRSLAPREVRRRGAPQDHHARTERARGMASTERGLQREPAPRDHGEHQCRLAGHVNRARFVRGVHPSRRSGSVAMFRDSRHASATSRHSSACGTAHGSGPLLYAGGTFTSAVGASAMHVARWALVRAVARVRISICIERRNSKHRSRARSTPYERLGTHSSSRSRRRRRIATAHSPADPRSTSLARSRPARRERGTAGDVARVPLESTPCEASVRRLHKGADHVLVPR
jgi:hypothetical protein